MKLTEYITVLLALTVPARPDNYAIKIYEGVPAMPQAGSVVPKLPRILFKTGLTPVTPVN
jgi:hypothetical protein